MTAPNRPLRRQTDEDDLNLGGAKIRDDTQPPTPANTVTTQVGPEFTPTTGARLGDHTHQFDALNESRSEREHWGTLTHEERRAFLRRHLFAVEVSPRAAHASIASPIWEDEVHLVWRERPGTEEA